MTYVSKEQLLNDQNTSQHDQRISLRQRVGRKNLMDAFKNDRSCSSEKRNTHHDCRNRFGFPVSVRMVGFDGEFEAKKYNESTQNVCCRLQAVSDQSE